MRDFQESLPSDFMNEIEVLKRRIKQLETDQQRVLEENQELRDTLAEKELELKLLMERFFGPKSERFIDDPNQLRLDFGDSDQVDDAIEGIKTATEELETEVEGYRRRKRKPRCEKLPEHLPREIVTIDLAEDEKEGLTCIGYDSTETLLFSPGKLSVRETRYLKYVAAENPAAGVKQPPREPGLVEGNRYDTTVAAQVLTAKYSYHLPVYRQQDIFAGSGWTPSRSTLLNILVATASLIRPLIAFFADQVRQDPAIGTDDTGVTLLLPKTVPKIDPDDPKSERVHDVIQEALSNNKPHVKAKMWAYRGISVPLNVFDFTVSRHRDGPDLFLIDNNYEGTLLGDCYGANTGIFMRSSGSIVHAACVAHARRKVREARDNHKEHTKQLLSLFGQLYDIEDRGHDLDVAGRLELRQTDSVAVWNHIRGYLDNNMSDVLPKDAMSKAIGYLNNQWTALTHHLTDASIPIDNNETEQLMKQIALGRKNWMFLGSVASGYRTADFMTLASSAIRNDLDVWAYVKGVLDALLSGETDYTSLRPDVWAASHPNDIRTYRVNEREQRATRQDRNRRQRRRVRESTIG